MEALVGTAVLALSGSLIAIGMAFFVIGLVVVLKMKKKAEGGA